MVPGSSSCRVIWDGVAGDRFSWHIIDGRWCKVCDPKSHSGSSSRKKRIYHWSAYICVAHVVWPVKSSRCLGIILQAREELDAELIHFDSCWFYVILRLFRFRFKLHDLRQCNSKSGLKQIKGQASRIRPWPSNKHHIEMIHKWAPVKSPMGQDVESVSLWL